MEETALYNNPGCKGCRFKDQENLCSFLKVTGVSRVAIGALSEPDGRCEMYRRNPKANMRPYRLDTPQTLELYEKGLNDRQMAKALGCSNFTVLNWRKRHGKPPNSTRGRPIGETKLDYQVVLDLYRKGHTDKEIAQKQGCSEATVRTWRKKYQKPPNGKAGRPKKETHNEND